MEDSSTEKLCCREDGRKSRKNTFTKIMKTVFFPFSNFLKMLYLFSKIVKKNDEKHIRSIFSYI